MTDPLSFPSTSPRYKLPFLFSGQAQKEFFVNSALQSLDMLLHPAIEEERDSPPTTPQAGQCWLIGAAPSAAWADKTGQLACWAGDQWLFQPPREGLSAYDKGAEQLIRYQGGEWQRGASVSLPAGGAVVDAELRTAFASLVTEMRRLGIIPD